LQNFFKIYEIQHLCENGYNVISSKYTKFRDIRFVAKIEKGIFVSTLFMSSCGMWNIGWKGENLHMCSECKTVRYLNSVTWPLSLVTREEAAWAHFSSSVSCFTQFMPEPSSYYEFVIAKQCCGSGMIFFIRILLFSSFRIFHNFFLLFFNKKITFVFPTCKCVRLHIMTRYKLFMDFF
jgi:hypothetical protein